LINVDLSFIAGVLVMAIWLFLIVLVVGLLAFAGRRRAIRRGTYPLHLLPWYLGGPPKIDAVRPDDTRSARDRSRHR